MTAPLTALSPGSWVLVTGGAGFIGSHLADALLASGLRVAVVDDLSTGNRANLPPEVSFHQGSILTEALDDAFRAHPVSAVVHCAAQVKVVKSMEDPALDLQVNVVGTSRVLAQAARARASRVVFISTGGALYGETPIPASEDTVPHATSFYAIHKYTAERYVELSGLSYGILRLANVFGPRQKSDLEGGVVSIFQGRLEAGRSVDIFGTGEQMRDFVYVQDVVEAILAALRTSQTGIWNIGTGRPTSVNELLHEMSSVIRPAAEIRHLPARPGEIFRSVLDARRAARDLGWTPRTSLEEGLRKTAAWQGR